MYKKNIFTWAVLKFVVCKHLMLNNHYSGNQDKTNRECFTLHYLHTVHFQLWAECVFVCVLVSFTYTVYSTRMCFVGGGVGVG